MKFNRAVWLLVFLFVVSCGKEGGRDNDEAGGGDNNPSADSGKAGEWSRLSSPCADMSEIALLIQDSKNWIAGCRGYTANTVDKGVGLFRTANQGKSWSEVEGWGETGVYDLAMMNDGKTLLLSGSRVASGKGADQVTEILWSADINDAKLTPTVLHTVEGLPYPSNGITISVLTDDTVYLHGVHNKTLFAGKLGDGLKPIKHADKTDSIFAFGDVLAAKIYGIATENLDILLPNRESGGDFWERVTVYNDPAYSQNVGLRMNYIDGVHYILGMKYPGTVPLVLKNEGNPYERDDWQEVALPEDVLGAGIGGVANIAIRGSTQVLVGITGGEPGTSWVATSTDNWGTATRVGRLVREADQENVVSLPDMSRQLGDSSVELKHVRFLDDGTVLAWGRDDPPKKANGQMGGYMIRSNK